MDINIQKPSLRIICLLTVVIILPFLVMHIMQQEMRMAFYDSIMLVCSAGLLFFGMRTEKYAQALVGQIIALAVVFSALFYFGNSTVIYWLFPVLLLPFYVLTKKAAVQLVAILSVALILLCWKRLDLADLIQISGALLVLLIIGYRMAAMAEDQNQQLKKKAHTDGLTGVGNRLGLDQRLIYYVNKFEVEKMPSTLLMMDIDHYGQMVENYGHGYGDQVVTELAGLLNESTRIDDEVFRYGGDVFVVILRGTSLVESEIPAQRISAKINSYKKGRIGNISVNMGLAELEEFDNYISWLSRADEALFDAKELRSREELAPDNAIVKKDALRAPAPKNLSNDD